jgi:type IV secretion system protein VirB6
MSGLFTAIGGTLEAGTTTYVTNVSAALSSAIVPAVTTAVTIWVLAYGFAVIRGEAHEPVPAFAWRGLKVAITLAFALGTGVYQSQVVTTINDATAGLAQTIQSAAAANGGGNPGCSAPSATSVTGSSAAAIYQTLDCYDQQTDVVMDAYFNKATHESVGVGMIAAALGDLACGLVAGFGGSIFLIVLGFEVVMARMMLDLVLGLGPVFIACAAFAPTARFFEAWTAKVANYALLQVLVAAFLGMALTAFSTVLAPLHATGAASGANASALMAQVQSALDGMASLAAAVGLFVTGVFLAMIGWQLPSVAAGLAGGATMSGFGAFVGGMAARSVVGVLAKSLPGGRNGSPGGSIRDTSGSIPAYQRAARDNLERDNG